MEVLNTLKEKGKIRAIGAANVTPEQVEEYLKYGDLDIVQAKYSVLDRGVEKELLPICKERGVVLQGIFSSGNGSVKRRPSERLPAGRQHSATRNGSSRKICRRYLIIWIS